MKCLLVAVAMVLAASGSNATAQTCKVGPADIEYSKPAKPLGPFCTCAYVFKDNSGGFDVVARLFYCTSNGEVEQQNSDCFSEKFAQDELDQAIRIAARFNRSIGCID